MPSTSADTSVSRINYDFEVKQTCISTTSVSETLAETRMVLSGISPQHCGRDAFDAHSGFPNYLPIIAETETITVADITPAVTDTTTFDSAHMTNTAVQTDVITDASSVTGTNNTALTDITNTTSTVAATPTTTARKSVSPISEF